MLRQFSIQRIIGSFLLDWTGTLAAFLIAASLRPRLGALPVGLQNTLHSLGITAGGVAGITSSEDIPYFPVIMVIAVLWPFFLVTFSVYDGRRNESLQAEMRNVFLAICVATAALAGLLFLTYRETSRVLFLLFFLLDVSFLVGGRVLLYVYCRLSMSNGRAKRRVGIIIGAGQVGRNAVQQLRKYACAELDLAGFLDDDPEKLGGEFEGLPVLGSLDQAPDIVARYHIQDAIIALPLRAHERLVDICNALQKQMVRVYVIPDLFALSFPNATLDGFGGIPVIDLGRPGIQGWRRFIKRAFDVAGATISLAFAAPLLALVALCIKLDSPGPVLYPHIRIGENGRLFKMYKFRSMRVGSDTGVHQSYATRLIRDNLTPEQVAKESGQNSLKMDKDPRITKIGKLIRKTSIDELPQLFNVLRGEMSLVGPRPPLPYEVEVYQKWHKRRLEAIPGITGLWQVKGRNRVCFDEMVRMDIEYLERQSLWMDLLILLQTPWALISARGAG